MHSKATPVGISGLAIYTPPFQVSLEAWCGWNAQAWDKVQAVIGHSFRQPGAHESIYTMAANAVLRLFERYDIDPQNVGYFAFGTESSTDNAAGAVIVRGMVDRALEARGRSRLSRACEVPETKHACLGGIYAMKAALRYLATDGRGKQAIVVCGDIAEYERGSSGEPTQGAGAVAMLLESDPRIAAIDLSRAGSSSDFRGVDFRKPVGRHRVAGYAKDTARYSDFPVFNGKYSTFCYQDAVVNAARAMFERIGGDPRAFYEDVAAVFMHRPYHWMPISGVTWMYVSGLAATEAGRSQLRALSETAKVSYDEVLAELGANRDLFDAAMTRGLDVDPYPAASAVVKAARKLPAIEALVSEKMKLGSIAMRDLGNLYTAALPAWLAAGLAEAARENVDLAGKTILAVGYGSGDAAEAIPMQIVDGWEDAALRIDVESTLAGAVHLTREQYEKRHDGVPVELPYQPRNEFVVDRVGERVGGEFQDVGIEYYRYVDGERPAAE